MTFWDHLLPRIPVSLRYCYTTVKDLETLMEPFWPDWHVKHAWNSVPDGRTSFAHNRSLRYAQAHYENSFISALYKISYHGCMLSKILPLSPVLTFDVPDTVIKGAGYWVVLS